MSSTNTTNLALFKATPGTAEPFRTSDVNSNWDKIDAALGQRTVDFATSTISNSVAETTLFTGSVPANPVQGSAWKAVFFGTYDNSAVSATLTFRFKLGGTTVATMAITTPASALTNKPWRFELEFVATTLGVTGTWRTSGQGTAVVNTTVTAFLDIPTAATILNTTTAQALLITAQWGTAAAANTARCDAGFIYRITNA